MRQHALYVKQPIAESKLNASESLQNKPLRIVAQKFKILRPTYG